MTDAHARLLAARDVLNRAERAVGLRARDDIEHGSTGASPSSWDRRAGPNSSVYSLMCAPPVGGSVCVELVISAGSGQLNRGWTSTVFSF